MATTYIMIGRTVTELFPRISPQSTKVIRYPSFYINPTWFSKPRDGIEVANPVTRIFLQWTTLAPFHVFLSSTKTPTQRILKHYPIFQGEPGTMSKINLRGISQRKTTIWGTNSLKSRLNECNISAQHV